MDVYSAKADISYLECMNILDVLENSEKISAFTESSDKSKKSLIEKVKEKIQKLFDAIKEFFTNAFGSKKYWDNKTKAVKDKHLENKKVQALDSRKLYALTKKYKDKISKAKTESEIDKIVEEYDKTSLKCVSTTAILSAIAICLINIKNVSDYKKDFDRVAEDDPNFKMYIKTKNGMIEDVDEQLRYLEKEGRQRAAVAAGSAATAILIAKISGITKLYSKAMNTTKTETAKTEKQINHVIYSGGSESAGDIARRAAEDATRANEEAMAIHMQAVNQHQQMVNQQEFIQQQQNMNMMMGMM